MKNLLLGIEFISSILLIILILMHSPKGEGLGSIGGQARMFNAQKGLESGLQRVTMIVAIIFGVTAIALGVL